MTRARDLSRLLNSITVDTNNNVGIGTTNPRTALNVVGVISATSFAGTVTGNISGNITGNVTGNINSTGVSTITTLNATSITGNINSTGVSTITTLNATSITGVSTAGITTAYIGAINDGAVSGTRNRIINGSMAIDQRNTGLSTTFTAAAVLQYSVDRWYGYCTGANVTGQRITTVGVQTGGLYTYQFTGASSVTGIGFGQRIESYNSIDLAGSTATLSVNLSNSLLTGVGWTAYYANSTDTFGTLASPNRTSISSGTFTVGATTSRYSTNISIPAAATTGIEIVFTVGAQTSGTWTIGNVQLEPGTVATPFERRSYGQELALCQRYYQQGKSWGYVINDSATNAAQGGGSCVNFSSQMRAAPTISSFSGSAFTALNIDANGFGFTNIGGQNSNITINATYAAFSEL